MKKVILIAVAMLGLAFAASAQPKALGLRAGYYGEISYEHFLGGDPNFLEVDLGLDDIVGTHQGFRATGTYNFVFAQPSWSPRGEWAWYAGPGATLGYVHYNDDYNMMLGLVGQLGVEYTFWFPLQISLDVRPVFGYCDGEFFNAGISCGFYPALSFRYRF